MERPLENHLSVGIKPVFNHSKIKGTHISRSSVGTMQKDHTAQDGCETLNEEKLEQAEKSSKILPSGILLSIAALIIFLYVSAFQWFHTFRESFWLDGKNYEMAGLTKFEDNGKVIYMPIFQEKK